MKESIRILSAKSDDDLHLIAKLAKTIWPETYKDIVSPEQIEYMLKMMYDYPVLKREFEHDNMQFRIIYHGEEPVGFFAYSPCKDKPDSIKLHKMYLNFNYHGHGIGSLALQYVISACKDAGYEALYLRVNKNNARAIKAYERNGFLIHKKVKMDIGNGFVMDDYVMKKSLV